MRDNSYPPPLSKPLNNNVLQSSDTSCPQASRLLWIDAMRGCSIILVVLGHVLMYMGIGGEKSALGSILMAFRMPLFFFVSGYFSYRVASWWNKQRLTDILKRKVYAQILGTVIFSSAFQYVMSNHVDFSDGFKGYWFTIVLFQMYLIYLIVIFIDISIKRNYGLIILAILSVGTAVYSVRGHEGFFYQFLCWQNLNHFLQFYVFGIICSKYRDKFFKLITNNNVITFTIIGLFCCLLIWPFHNLQTNYLPVYYSIRYEMSKYFALLTVIILFYGLKSYWEKDNKFTRVMIFIGQRTLDIYLIHYFFLPDLSFLASYISSGNMFVIQLLLSAIITSIVVMMSLFVSAILRKSNFLSQLLFGTKRRIA